MSEPIVCVICRSEPSASYRKKVNGRWYCQADIPIPRCSKCYGLAEGVDGAQHWAIAPPVPSMMSGRGAQRAPRERRKPLCQWCADGTPQPTTAEILAGAVERHIAQQTQDAAIRIAVDPPRVRIAVEPPESDVEEHDVEQAETEPARMRIDTGNASR